MTLKRLVELDRGPERVVNITNHIKTHSQIRPLNREIAVSVDGLFKSVFLYGPFFEYPRARNLTSDLTAEGLTTSLLRVCPTLGCGLW